MQEKSESEKLLFFGGQDTLPTAEAQFLYLLELDITRTRTFARILLFIYTRFVLSQKYKGTNQAFVHG